MAKHNIIGKLGEDIACMFLVKHGYLVIERNYFKKWGELDIVASIAGITCFVEVKSVSRETLDVKNPDKDAIRPEENMHGKKLKRLARVIETYLLQKKLMDSKWRIDLMCVYIYKGQNTAAVRHIKDIIIS